MWIGYQLKGNSLTHCVIKGFDCIFIILEYTVFGLFPEEGKEKPYKCKVCSMPDTLKKYICSQV